MATKKPAKTVKKAVKKKAVKKVTALQKAIVKRFKDTPEGTIINGLLKSGKLVII